MQKEKRGLFEILAGMAGIGFLVQIVCGIVWLFLHSGTQYRVAIPRLFCMSVGLYGLFTESGCPGGPKKMFRLLIVLTFPLVLQTCFTPTGDAYVCAFGLLSWCVLGRLQRSKRQFCRVLTQFWIVVIFVGLSLFATYRIDKGVSVPRPAAMAADRFAWSSLDEIFQRCPDAVQEAVPAPVIRETKSYADNINRVLVPALTKQYGVHRVDQILWALAKTGLLENTKGNLGEILWDFCGNVLAPAVVGLELAGYGYASYTAAHYDALLREGARFGAFFWEYGVRFFVVVWCLCVFVWLSGKKQKATLQGGVRLFLPVFLVGFHTLRGAGMMDYQKTIFVVCLWFLWMLQTVGEDRV